MCNTVYFEAKWNFVPADNSPKLCIDRICNADYDIRACSSAVTDLCGDAQFWEIVFLIQAMFPQSDVCTTIMQTGNSDKDIKLLKRLECKTVKM